VLRALRAVSLLRRVAVPFLPTALRWVAVVLRLRVAAAFWPVALRSLRLRVAAAFLAAARL